MNSSTTPATGQTWNGWARIGSRGRWRLLVRCAATADEARDQLRALIAPHRLVDSCVLPAGRNPNDRHG